MSESRPVPDALIRLRGISKVYGRGQAALRALDGVDLRVEGGEFVAIMGPSGSGKSTIMNILGCLHTPTSGEYLFCGVHVHELTRDQRARLRQRHVGFVARGSNLLPRTSAQTNVELPLLFRGETARSRHRAARAALRSVGLAGWEQHMPSELCGGHQQRVAIARAIVTKPTLLLAEEPTGNLDTLRSHKIMQLLAGLNRDRGITILMVTHERDMASYARRIVMLTDGHVGSDTLNEQPMTQAHRTRRSSLFLPPVPLARSCLSHDFHVGPGDAVALEHPQPRHRKLALVEQELEQGILRVGQHGRLLR